MSYNCGTGNIGYKLYVKVKSCKRLYTRKISTKCIFYDIKEAGFI